MRLNDLGATILIIIATVLIFDKFRGQLEDEPVKVNYVCVEYYDEDGRLTRECEEK